MSGREGDTRASTGADIATGTGDSSQEPKSVPVDGAGAGDGKTKHIDSTVQFNVDDTEHAMVHFQENTTSDPEERPEPTTIFGKIYRWWDCDLVWIGFLLLATVVAFTMFITFIVMSSGGDKQPVDPSHGETTRETIIRS